jgi:hypothetical protein
MPDGSVSQNDDNDNIGEEKEKAELSPVKGKKHKGEGDSPKKDKTDREIDCSIPHIMTDAMRYKKPPTHRDFHHIGSLYMKFYMK